jgi:uncharacterized protein (TIGR03437 family)
LCAAFLARASGQDSSVNTIAAVGYLPPAPVVVAPGQVVTVFVEGNVQGAITATVQQISDHPAPVLGVTPPANCVIAPTSICSATTAVTIQIPYEIVPDCFVCALPASFNTQLFVSVNGAAGALFGLTPVTDRVHLLTACDSLVSNGGGPAPYNGLPCPPLVTHADGSLVALGSPANGGEEIVAYAVGLGATTPAVPTGQAAATATPAAQTFSLAFNFLPNALAAKPVPPAAAPLYAGLTPGFVGLYQINFIVPQPPAGMAACSSLVQSNLTVSVGGQNSFDGGGICVAPSQ